MASKTVPDEAPLLGGRLLGPIQGDLGVPLAGRNARLLNQLCHLSAAKTILISLQKCTFSSFASPSFPMP